MNKINKGDTVRIVNNAISGREDGIGKTGEVLKLWSDDVASVIEENGREGAYPLQSLLKLEPVKPNMPTFKEIACQCGKTHHKEAAVYCSNCGAKLLTRKGERCPF